jgi:hypothetical protein
VIARSTGSSSQSNLIVVIQAVPVVQVSGGSRKKNIPALSLMDQSYLPTIH